MEKFYALLENNPRPVSMPPVDDRVLVALLDDLNTPSAIGALHALAREASAADGAERTRLVEVLRSSSQFLGLLQEDASAWFASPHRRGALEDEEVQRLLEERRYARSVRDFVTSDRIRDILIKMGHPVQDGRV